MSEEWIDGFSDKLRGKAESTTGKAMVSETLADNETMSIGEQITEIDHRLRSLKQLTTITLQPDETSLTDRKFVADHQVKDLGVLIDARKRIDQIDSQQVMDSPITTHSESGKNELGLLRQQLEKAQQQLDAEQTRYSYANSPDVDQNNTLKRVTNELEIIKNKLKEREGFELKRRQDFEQQLVIERKKMSEQLARFASGIELYQSRSREIERVKQLAVLETQQLIKKFKTAHEEYRHRHTMTIQRVRKELQQQAAQVLEKARSAQMEKQQALAALRDVQKQLDELRQQRGLPDNEALKNDVVNRDGLSDVPLLREIESIGEQIDEAKQKLNVEEYKLTLAD